MCLAKRRGRDVVMSFSAQHGAATSGQAPVTASYVRIMSELVEARDAYERRKRFAIAHLSRAVGRELGLDTRQLSASAAAAETHTPQPAEDQVLRILDVATAYQAMVAERPHRERLSEAEALDELLNCPALGDASELATAFARVLSGEVRPS